MVAQSSEILLRKLIVWVLRFSTGDSCGGVGGGSEVVVERSRSRGLGFVRVLD